MSKGLNGNIALMTEESEIHSKITTYLKESKEKSMTEKYNNKLKCYWIKLTGWRKQELVILKADE